MTILMKIAIRRADLAISFSWGLMTRTYICASVLAAILGLLAFSTARGQPETPMPNPNQLNKVGRAPHCQAAIDSVLAEEARWLELVDRLLMFLKDPEDLKEDIAVESQIALMDRAGLCSSCVLERRIMAQYEERRQKDLEKTLCGLTGEKRAVYLIGYTIPGENKSALLMGPVVMTRANFEVESARLSADILLNQGPKARLVWKNTTEKFSCGFAYEKAGKLHFGTTTPDTLAKTMKEKALYGAKILSPGVCRD